MNRNLNRRIHPIAEADGLSPKKNFVIFFNCAVHTVDAIHLVTACTAKR